MVTLARKQVQLVEYLFKRLSQLGIKAVHGVPGDFNIVALDYIHDAGLQWVGDANELNAGKSLPSLTQQ
jgi:pyruvate decarboxylase